MQGIAPLDYPATDSCFTSCNVGFWGHATSSIMMHIGAGTSLAVMTSLNSTHVPSIISSFTLHTTQNTNARFIILGALASFATNVAVPQLFDPMASKVFSYPARVLWRNERIPSRVPSMSSSSQYPRIIARSSSLRLLDTLGNATNPPAGSSW